MRRLAIGVALLLGGALARTSQADKVHRLHRVGPDSVDLVVSVAWDSDDASAPGKDYLTDAFRQFASRTQQMTLGHVSVCTVYVYFDRRHADVADMIVADTADRSNADTGGIHSPSRHMWLYRNGRDAETFGNVMAHELGHYALNLGDEYPEPTADERNYAQAHVCDARVESVMGRSGSYAGTNLSVPGDYTERTHTPWVWKEGPHAGKTTGSKEARYADCDSLVEGSPSLAKEDATWRTAQWRRHQESAWETLIDSKSWGELPRKYESPRFARHPFSSLQELTEVPADLTPPAWDGGCFQVVFMEGSVGALFIDASLSMNEPAGLDPDPDKTKFAFAIEAALAYVDSVAPGNAVTIYLLSSSTPYLPVTWIAGTPSEQQSARNQIKAKIQQIQPATGYIGSTSISLGLQNAYTTLMSKETLGARHYALVLSDGNVIPDAWAVQPYADRRIPIFTVRFGSALSVRPEYDLLWKNTGGKRLTHLLMAVGFKQVRAHLDKSQTLGTHFFPQPLGGNEPPVEVETDVTAIDGSTAFEAHWAGDALYDVTLVAPDQSTITAQTLPPGVSYESMPGSAGFVVDAPMPGRWRTVITPSALATEGDLAVSIHSQSPLRLVVVAEGSGEYPEPWIVTARLAAPEPLVGADVVARFVDGPVSLPELALRDDGEGADQLAGDGVYTAVVSNVVENGSYSVEVEATNDSGAASIDAAALGHGSDQPPQPISAFVRNDAVVLEATNYHEMPQSAADAIHVRNDFTPVWGTINAPGDVAWYRFNGYATGRYLVMTGNLVENDGQPMRTRVTLYDADGSTELESQQGEDGRARLEVVVPANDQVYYLKVEHPDQGLGRFQLAVAPAEWFEEPNGKGGSSSSGGCALRGNPRVAPWSVLLALAALGVARRRSRRFDRERHG